MPGLLICGTLARRLRRLFCFSALCIPCYAEALGSGTAAAVLFLIATCTDFKAGENVGGRSGIMICGTLERDFKFFFLVVGLMLIEDITCEY